MKIVIVLVDDDPTTHASVKNVIDANYQLVACFNLKQAMEALDNLDRLSLIIIDRVLPDGDGLDLCAKMRSSEKYKDVPIIFLSGKTSDSDKVSGLYAGADDYIVKPVSPLELKARIQARLRFTATNRITVGNLIIDLGSHRTFLSVDNSKTELELTRIEFKILITMAQSPDRVFSRDSIIEHAWGINSHVTDRVVDTHVSHLRKKISKSNIKIEALRGEGYKLYVFNSEKVKRSA